MPTRLTTAQTAAVLTERLGRRVNRQHVLHAAKRLGLGLTDAGEMWELPYGVKGRLFTPARDVEALGKWLTENHRNGRGK
jgi:hypothetical protein